MPFPLLSIECIVSTDALKVVSRALRCDFELRPRRQHSPATTTIATEREEKKNSSVRVRRSKSAYKMTEELIHLLHFFGLHFGWASVLFVAVSFLWLFSFQSFVDSTIFIKQFCWFTRLRIEVETRNDLFLLRSSRFGEFGALFWFWAVIVWSWLWSRSKLLPFRFWEVLVEFRKSYFGV